MKNHLHFLKHFFIALFLTAGFCITGSARTYYVSNAGNDNNDGLSTSSSWQTLNRVSSYNGFGPGDAILFNRGDVFYGQLTISNSGSSGNPITIGAYGSGPKPVFSGFTTVNNWTNLGGNIWESTNAVSNLPATNMVVINNVNTQMGRFPNSGYLTYKSHVGKTSITDNVGLTGSPNWTGAELALFTATYVIDRCPITAQSGGTLSYTATSPTPIQRDGLNYFIQNDPRTLDTTNEWYFNPSTKKLRVYSIGSPANVQVGTIDTLVNLDGGNNSNYGYIIFDNIALQGSNKISVHLRNSKYITIQNSDFNFSGGYGVYGPYWGNSTGLTIQGCTFNHSNNGAISVTGDFDNALIKNNVIKNTGVLPGMCNSGDDNSLAVYAVGASSNIQYNNIDSTGYIGIRFDQNYTVVRNNFVSNFLMVKVDGGGIYTWNGNGPNRTVFVGRVVSNNIVMNSPAGSGIYMDDGSQGVEISGNTVANVPYGIYIHGNQNMNVHDNTVYNCSTTQLLFSSEVYEEIRNVSLNNNIFFSKDPTQLDLLFQTKWNDIALFGTANNNYYARPIDDSLVFNLYINGSYWPPIQYGLSGWQGYVGQDLNSKKSPKTITTTNDLKFVYNAGPTNQTIGLDANYIDVKGTSYNGSINLSPYTSAVLIKNGPTINTVTANAGQDQTITLPSNTINLSGGGTGPITSYQWRQLSGPSSVMPTPINYPAYTVYGMVQGIYQFELKVSDVNGNSKLDTMQVTVNPASIPSSLVTANAGPDQTITLPTTVATLSGSGTGPITAYQWRQLSGPSIVITNTINYPAYTVFGLVQGVYQFELKASDANGNNQLDTMQVTVNGANTTSSLITANAGPDQTVSSPASMATLSGSGTGPISSYQWRQISGPSIVMTTINYPAYRVFGLVQGVYQFELTAFDANGNSQLDTMQITVNSPRNQSSLVTANAGPDQTISSPTTMATLSGSGTGPIAGYQWREISGPSIVMTPVNYPDYRVFGLIQGTYQFELTAIDSNGNSSEDTMQVNVNTANYAPIFADAGPDQTIVLPTTVATLSGSGSGPIASYHWRQLSGPSVVMSTINYPAYTVFGLVQGIYQFELTASDIHGNSSLDTMTLTVNSADNNNIPIAVDAGPDQNIILPNTFATLTGSGSGPITSYLWQQLSGPSNVMPSNINYPAYRVFGLVQGVYQFQLTAYDINGNSQQSTVQVTVNPVSTVYATKTANPNSVQTIAALGNSSTPNTISDSSKLIANSSSIQISQNVPGNNALEFTGLKIYPNPVQTITTLEINVIQPNSNLLITLTDMRGATVYRKEINSGIGIVKEQINMSAYSKGTYAISVLQNGKKIQTLKVVKM